MKKNKNNFIVVILVLTIFIAFCCTGHLYISRKFDVAKQYHCYSDIVLLLGEPLVNFDLEKEGERITAYKMIREKLEKQASAYSNKKVAIWSKSRIGAQCFWVEYEKDTQTIIRNGTVGL